MREEDGRNVTVVSLLNQARQGRARQCLTDAATASARKNDVKAMEAYAEAARLQPLNREIRERLAHIAGGRAGQEDAEAARFLSQGAFEEGVAALERAQSLAPSPERAARLEKTQTALEFQKGMEFYNAKQYAQAIFQFQKVLGRDPNHAEAKRHLQYAQKFASDSGTEQVQSRFSMLE
jgi:tetratricopeptide (TPR) repeat protein